MVNAQEWLDREYPKEQRNEVSEIYLNEPSLEGELDLGDFTYKHYDEYRNEDCSIKLYISSQVDETKLIFKNKPKGVEIILQNTQKWLEQNYPKNGTCIRKKWNSREKIWENHQDFGKKRSEIKELDIHDKKLEGSLNLNDFINLKELYCSRNRLINLDLTNCEKLKKIVCWDNLLTSIILPSNPTNLKELSLEDNNLPGQDLIDEYGWCWKCRCPNTSENWCQPCSEQEWKKDLEQLTGQELVEKFIKKQPTKTYMEVKLQWIPYEQFTNIEHIADGGFSKVYKAEWKEYKENPWSKSNNKDIVLKSLTNSQNITLEFLTEIANNKLVYSCDSIYSKKSSNVVQCYGISQDPDGNYIMVMEYMKDGNLRQHLQNEFGWLNLKDKIKRLENIANGLKTIHEQNLVHRDFHSGNILKNTLYPNSRKGLIDIKVCITDLGLSQPANYQKKEGQIFGVLPYIAPEVLRGQPYTQKSDIYSFGIIAHELLTNSYPYPKMDDTDLALKVCQGYRPSIDKIPLPLEVKDLIKKCWDADPNQRPNAKELERTIGNWNFEIREWEFGILKTRNRNIKELNLFCQQYLEIVEKYNTFSQKTPYQVYPNATTASKMIDTNKITKQLDNLNLSEKINVQKSKEIFLKDSEEIAPIEVLPQPIDWANIHSSFTDELIQQWQEHNFTFEQCRDWINAGLKPFLGIYHNNYFNPNTFKSNNPLNN